MVNVSWERYGIVAALVVGSLIGGTLSLLMPLGEADNPAGPMVVAESHKTNVEVAGRQLIREDDDMLESVIIDASRHVVRVKSQACGVDRQGTATFIEHAGKQWLLTNNHVVEGTSTVTIALLNGEELFVDVIGSVDGRDVAVLDPQPLLDRDDMTTAFVPMQVGRRVNVGDPVATAGFPANEFATNRGWVESSERRHGAGQASQVMVLDVPVVGGYSGGMVIGPDGGAAGIIAAQDPISGGAVAYYIDDITGRPLRSLESCP